jgi:hypothetical protein
LRASFTLLTKTSKVSSAYSSSGRLARPNEKRRLNIDISSLSEMLGLFFITPSAHMRVTTSVIPMHALTLSSGLRLRGKRGSTSCIHCIDGSVFLACSVESGRTAFRYWRTPTSLSKKMKTALHSPDLAVALRSTQLDSDCL